MPQQPATVRKINAANGEDDRPCPLTRFGLQYAKGLILASAFYWDLTEETRTWTKRFMERSKKYTHHGERGRYYRLLKTVPGLQAFRPLADGGCPMIAKKGRPGPLHGPT